MQEEQEDRPLPPLAVCFDGKPDNLAYFLTQIWNYMERHGVMYRDKHTRSMLLHLTWRGVQRDGSPQRGGSKAARCFHVAAVRQIQRPHNSPACIDCICSLHQGKWPVAEYIQDFCSLVDHLRDWPELYWSTNYGRG